MPHDGDRTARVDKRGIGSIELRIWILGMPGDIPETLVYFKFRRL